MSWRLPFVACGIAIILTIAFWLELRAGFDFTAPDAPGIFSLKAFGALEWDKVAAGDWWRIFTAPLLHGSSSHLIGNLIALIAAGALLEPRIGSSWFAAIYLVGGVAGSLLAMIVNPADMPTVGASGAIMACVAALFVFAFHDSAKRPRLMQRVAGFLLFPALVPSVTDSGATVDIYCHVGGLLAGVALAFAIMIGWQDEEDVLPPGRTGAAIASLLIVLVSGWAALQPAAAIDAYASQAADYIPTAEIVDDLDQMKAKSAVLVRKYPNDPRAHFFRGFYFLSKEDAPAAEQQLRIALRLERERPGIVPPVLHTLMKAVLALDLEALGRHGEAVTAAKEACASDVLPPPLRVMLTDYELCR